MIHPQYLYKATVTEVYDGDTITVDIDLGLNVWLKDQTLRLLGIDTPELRGEEREEGLRVRDWVRARLLGETVVIQTVKDKTGKYGRWLAIVWIKGENFNQTLLMEKMATKYGS